MRTATTGLSPTGPIHGREAYKQAFLEFAQAFPSKSLTIDEIFGVEDVGEKLDKMDSPHTPQLCASTHSLSKKGCPFYSVSMLDRVVARFTAVVTHAQDYFGVAATQREIVLKEMHLMRIEDGKIVENIVSATNLEFEMLMAPVVAPLILDEPK